MTDKPTSAVVPQRLDGCRLDAVVRDMFDLSWGRARRLVSGGKIAVDGRLSTDGGQVVKAGAALVNTPDAPRPKGRHEFDPGCVVHEDRHVIVAGKPAGILTVPFERGDRDCFDHQLRGYLSRRSAGSSSRRGALPSLMVVHRLDKATSGLLVFAKTWAAKEGLAAQLREHSMEREYLALVHGVAHTKRIVSHILEDRGDGIRGSRETSPHPAVRRSKKGRRAITDVRLVKALQGASLVACKLETGRTNQIRIHMSEDGHPLVGERIYMRGFAGEKIRSGRLMLHAARLGFVHPVSGESLSFEAPLPAEFARLEEELSVAKG